MNETTAPNFDDETVALAQSTMPVFVVAESPDGQVLSYDSGYPDDDTKVWKASGGDHTTLGELYAEYGDDLIAYAEPEPRSVAASLDETELAVSDGGVLPPVPETSYAPDATPIPADLADDTADAVDPETVAAAAQYLDEIETFLDVAEVALTEAAVTAGLDTIPHQQVSLTTMRKAVGGNPTAQADIVKVFESAASEPDVDRFITVTLGSRPAPDANHDEEAWDATAKEARVWHAKNRAVVASLRTIR